MTEITFVGDVHSNFSQFIKLTKKKKKTTFFVQVGDFGLFSSRASAQKDTYWKIPDTRKHMESFIDLYKNDKIKKFNAPVYFIKGIHDDFDIDKEYLKHKNLFFIEEGTIIEDPNSNIRVACLGGIKSVIKIKRKASVLVDNDRRFFTLGEIENLKREVDANAIDVLVTHQAATGCVPIRHNVKQEEGARELRNLLDYIKPKYYIHGHHHHNYVRHEETYPIIIGLGNFGKNRKSYYTLTI